MKTKLSLTILLAASVLLGSALLLRAPVLQGATAHPQVTIEHYSLGTSTIEYQIGSATADIIKRISLTRAIPGSG